jgi:hypothetical protein
LVETRNRILSKAKLALRPMTILASSLQRQASLRIFPFRAHDPDPAPARAARSLHGAAQKALDSADDRIHRTLTYLHLHQGAWLGSLS